MSPNPLFDRLAGKPRPRGKKPTVLVGAWGVLADRAGGISALAKRCSISRSTLRRWGIGEIVCAGPGAELVRRLCEEYQIACPLDPPCEPDPAPGKPDPMRVTTKKGMP